MTWWVLIVAIIASNFVHQLLKSEANWEEAAQRTFFQYMTVLIVWLVKPWE